MKAYLFWYIPSKYGTTEYVYVIAVSVKQAQYFWYNYVKYTLGNVYDFDYYPCYEVEGLTRHHEVGDILGQNAIL